MKRKIAALTVALSASVAAAPPDANELFCYTIGPYAAPGFVVHDTPTILYMITWPYEVEATWARDNQNYTFDDQYDFALRVRLVYWPFDGGDSAGVQQVVTPNDYMTDVNRIDVISGGHSIGFDPVIQTFWSNGDRLQVSFDMLDVVDDEFLFVIYPQCDGDLNLDTHRNIGDIITCINQWSAPYGIPDLISVINNFGDECP